MNAADSVLQRSFPTVMVPRREPVAPMTTVGERLLMAENGVFLEISRSWISIARRVAEIAPQVSIPYGRAKEYTELMCGRVPEELIGEFVAMARAAHPNETGAWIVYERPHLQADEVLVVDCHSHGSHPAFFSATDNEDDKHDVKFSLVVGKCASRVPNFAFRLCAKGIFEDIPRVPAAWYAVSTLAEAV